MTFSFVGVPFYWRKRFGRSAIAKKLAQSSTGGANLLLNGTFSDTSAWTLGSGVSISGGVLTTGGASAGQLCWQPVTYVNGGTYQLDFDYSAIANTDTKLRANLSSTNAGDIAAVSGLISTDGATHHISLTFTANVTNGYLSIEADSDTFNGMIDNVVLVRTA